ncbi:MAG: rod shape-determining protein MreC [Fibrobacteria bacterium]|nr:rod shape-determining protein MreC [Fibrobacteria bacterium]
MLILRWLLSTATRGKEIVSIFLIVGFAVWLARSPVALQNSWRMAMTGTVFYPIQVVVDQVHFRMSLKEQIRRLQSENAILLADNAALSAAARSKAQWQNLKRTASPMPWKVVPARVVSRNPLRLGGIWVVDAGSAQGVQEGMAAFTPRGVVGRILASGTHHSDLQSIVDPDCRISVLSTRSRNPGIVYSPDGARILLEFSATSDILVGDSLVSWGAGGIFPKGLPVGRVVAIVKSPAKVVRTAMIELFQDPWKVEDVAIVLKPISYAVDTSTVLEPITRPILDSLAGRRAP